MMAMMVSQTRGGMCSGFQEFLVAVDLSRGEAADILPGIIRQIADRRVETILLVGLFDVDLYTVVWLHLGMHDLGVVRPVS